MVQASSEDPKKHSTKRTAVPQQALIGQRLCVHSILDVNCDNIFLSELNVQEIHEHVSSFLK